MHVAVRVLLLVWPPRPIALAVGHGDGESEIVRLRAVHVREEPCLVIGAFVLVDAVRGLKDGAEGVAAEIAHRAARLLADDTDGLELVEQVGAGGGDVQHPVHGLPGGLLRRRHHRREHRAQREVVRQADGVDAGREPRFVSDGLDGVAVDVHVRPVAPERFAVIG